MIKKCPRCDVNLYTDYSRSVKGVDDPPYPALSRVADIYICNDCGTKEAMRDMSGEAPIPPDEWPVGGNE